MRRDDVGLWSPAIGAEGRVVAYGHWGRPVLVFPSQEGRRWDFEQNGMVDAVGGLIEAGRVKLYCVDSFDAGSWMRDDLPLEERARLHERYEDWIVSQVIPFIHADCGGAGDVLATGCSLGAYHAAILALRRADLVPAALCMSGVYDLSRVGWGERGLAFHVCNPMDTVTSAHGDHLAWLQARLSLQLVVGRGSWEDSTGALESTHAFAQALAHKGIRHGLDVWGHDTPHDWPSWRRQLAHHLPRFC